MARIQRGMFVRTTRNVRAPWRMIPKGSRAQISVRYYFPQPNGEEERFVTILSFTDRKLRPPKDEMILDVGAAEGDELPSWLQVDNR